MKSSHHIWLPTFRLQVSIFSILILVLIGCDLFGDTEPESYIRMRLNGAHWKGNEYMNIVNRDGLYLISSNRYVPDKYPLLDYIGIGECSEDYECDSDFCYVNCDDYFSFWENDGDAGIARYGLFEMNYFEFDTQNTEIWSGHFAAVFVVDDAYAGYPQRRLPDTLRVTQGRFYIVLDELHRNPYEDE